MAKSEERIDRSQPNPPGLSRDGIGQGDQRQDITSDALHHIHQIHLTEWRRLLACCYFHALRSGERPKRLEHFRRSIDSFQEAPVESGYSWAKTRLLIALKTSYVITLRPEERPARLTDVELELIPLLLQATDRGDAKALDR